MNGIDLLPLAVAHMIGLGPMGSCIGIGLLDGAFIIATGIGLWFATTNPFAR